MKEVDQSYKSFLEENEEVIWSGKPVAGIRFEPFEIILMPISLAAGAVMISTTVGILKALSSFVQSFNIADDLIPLLMGILACSIIFFMALFLMFGRFFFDAKRRENTFYYLTKKRAIIVSGIFRRKIQAVSLMNISDVSLLERSKGLGIITFGPSTYFFPFYRPVIIYGMFTTVNNLSPIFELIPNASAVYAKIQSIRNSQ